MGRSNFKFEHPKEPSMDLSLGKPEKSILGFFLSAQQKCFLLGCAKSIT